MAREDDIIGYFAATKRGDVACDGPACIIAGSYKAMKEYLLTAGIPSAGKFKVTKTRFGEVLSGMRMGGAYSFDAESYGRFLSLAREEGMDCEEADFTPDKEGGVKFMIIMSTRRT